MYKGAVIQAHCRVGYFGNADGTFFCPQHSNPDSIKGDTQVGGANKVNRALVNLFVIVAFSVCHTPDTRGLICTKPSIKLKPS